MEKLRMNRFFRWRKASFAVAILVSILGLYSTDKMSVARAQICMVGDNRIVCENRCEGTSTCTDRWRMTNNPVTTGHQVEGYASTTSISPGELINLFVNVSNPVGPATVGWEIFRLGYYGGLGGRSMASGTINNVPSQLPCLVVDWDTLLVQCAWNQTFQIPTRTTWVTGQYLIKLTRVVGQTTWESYVPIVIRETTPRAPLLFQASVTTWQAYNTYGGASLYRNDTGQRPLQNRAYRVSFDRPYQNDQFATGEPLWWEVYMLRWLEKRGYDLAYVTNVDIDADEDNLNHPLLAGRPMFLSVGHDEYWSIKERGSIQRARDNGVSLGFFSANTSYWRIRLEDSVTVPPVAPVARRVVTCYKDWGIDLPQFIGTPSETVKWRDNVCGQQNPCAQPENALLGVMFEGGAEPSIDGFPLMVTNAGHPIYNGIPDVANGMTLPHIVGGEWDHIFPNDSPAGLVPLAHALGVGEAGTQVPTDMTIYSLLPGPSNIVFAAGTITWAWGLTNPDVAYLGNDYQDPRIQRITENVLNLAGLGLPPIDGTFTVVPRQPDPPTDATATAVTLVAGTGQPGYVNGLWNDPTTPARFNSPAGVAVGPDGKVYVTEARNHRIRAIGPNATDPNRTVSTVAGGGPIDVTDGSYLDGQGEAARFNVPTGIVMVPPSTLYVSDTGNHCIRKIDVTPGVTYGTVTTYAGAPKAGGGCIPGDADNPSDPTNPRAAMFNSPRGLALGPDGALYVADTLNGKIRRISSAGRVTTLGPVQGQPFLSQPTAVAISADGGTVYTLETANPQVQQILRTQQGEPPVFGLPPVPLAGGRFGDSGGPGSQARLRPADGLIVFNLINPPRPGLVFSDMANFRVRTVDLSGPPYNYTVSTLVGNGRFGTGVGTGSSTQVVLPRGITPCPGVTGCPSGNFVVADSANHRILMVQP